MHTVENKETEENIENPDPRIRARNAQERLRKMSLEELSAEARQSNVD